jgi:DNA-binding transcriptional LysR family regulator
MESHPELSWDDLRVLLAISRTGSFKGAARAMRVSTSTVSRRVDALERVLGQRVVRRLSEGATIEPRAAVLLQLAARLEGELAIAARDVGDEQAEVSGRLRVALGAGFLRFVSEAVTRFRAQYPLVDFELIVDPRPADIAKREADLALRTGMVDGDGVVYRQAGPLPFGLFAGERFIARHGSLTVSDLGLVDVIGYCGDMASQPVMPWFREAGVQRFPVLASSTEGVIACALDGLGVAALPTAVASAVDGLKRIASPAVPPGKSVYVAFHRDLRAVPKVKRFADLMIETLKRSLSP